MTTKKTTAVGMADTFKLEDLRQLKADLLKQEIRVATADAAMAEIRLAKALDEERDRQARGGLHRRLPIDGVIYGSSIDTWIAALEHWEYRDPAEPITITIDSPGGDVLGGFGIFDTILRLRRKGHHVTTRGRGMVASMAAVLLQAGDDRVMDQNAQLMIHEVSFRTGGKLSEMEDDVNFTRRIQDRLLNILADRSTLTTTQIKRRWKKMDWWMDAEEALKLGFVDRIE